MLFAIQNAPYDILDPGVLPFSPTHRDTSMFALILVGRTRTSLNSDGCGNYDSILRVTPTPDFAHNDTGGQGVNSIFI